MSRYPAGSCASSATTAVLRAPITPADPPLYLTWMVRPGPGGSAVRLQIDEIDAADSLQEAEDIWLPVLEALQRLVNPGSLLEAAPRPVRDQIIPNGPWYLIPAQV